MLVEGTLYRPAANGILLKCISREQGVELIADATGEAAHSPRTLAQKAFVRFYRRSLQDAQIGSSVARRANFMPSKLISRPRPCKSFLCGLEFGHPGAL